MRKATIVRLVNASFKKLDAMMESLSRAWATLAGVAVVAMALMVVAYIISRELNIKWEFVEEWSGYLLVLIGYFAMAYVLRRGEHIRVDIVAKRMPKRVRAVVEVFTSLLALAVLGLMIERSINLTLFNWENQFVSQFASHTPLWIPNVFVPLGLIIFMLALILHTARSLADLVRGG